MSYTKQVWHTGDLIIDSKLNHIEQGVADADCELFLVNVNITDATNITSDMTFAEVMAKISDGYLPVYNIENETYTTNRYALIQSYTGTNITIYSDQNDTLIHDSTGVFYNT